MRLGSRVQASLDPIEQGQPDVLLQRCNQTCGCRLGDVQHLGGAGNGLAKHHGAEGFEVAKIHGKNHNQKT
ncbi:hypothetical protein D3C78_1560840 [compost metagenome]